MLHNVLQVDQKCALMTLGMSMFNNVRRWMPMLHNVLQVDQKCALLTLDISMLKNIFLLHTIMQICDTYH